MRRCPARYVLPHRARFPASWPPRGGLHERSRCATPPQSDFVWRSNHYRVTAASRCVTDAGKERALAETLNATINIGEVRRRFSALGGGFAFLDAPGGSQVPDEVGDAIARAMREASANMGAGYATSFRVKEILETAEAHAARFLGCDPHEITFGPNMTSLDFTFSRTVGRDFKPGDEILVSSADHDGGVAPWLELAHDRDLVVRHIELHPDTTLDFEDLAAKLADRPP